MRQAAQQAKVAALAAAVLALAPASRGGAAEPRTFVPPEMEDYIFYQVITDRFDNGSPANDTASPRGRFAPADGFGIHGGDFEGIRRQLPYIKRLGANAIWISPFLENTDGAYHGYSTYDWYKIDPHFGTKAELDALIADANALGIAIFFDMITNHGGQIINSGDAGFPNYLAPPAEYNLRWSGSLRYPPPFDSLTHYHAHGEIQSFVRPNEEIGELVGLDDLKTETQYVRDEMVNIWTYWIQNTGVTGFRVDTVKHVDRGFWNDFLPRLRANATAAGRTQLYVFGEVYGADDNFMADYVGDLDGNAYKFDSALDFQYYYTSNEVFARGTGNTSWMASRLVNRVNRLGEQAHLRTPNWIDNHDLPRFLNTAAQVPGTGLAERHNRLELALSFLFASPGPPIVYYGTEQAFDGGNDPNNREDMFDGSFERGPSLGNNFTETSRFYRHVRRLSQLRTALAPLRRGSSTFYQTANGPGILAMARRHAGQEVLVVLNTATTERSLNSLTTSFAAGTVLEDGLNPGNTITVGASGFLASQTVAAQSSHFWVPQSLLPPSPPEVIAMAPANGEGNVTTDTDPQITFSAPMNRAAVEAAVSFTPSIAYTPVWSSDSRTLTLDTAAALSGRTSYTVSVAASATTTLGTPLEVPARSTWRTGRAGTLAPAPAAQVVYRSQPGTITLDGAGAEWAGNPAQADDTGVTINDGTIFIWKDSTGDDLGPGSYTYPTNSVFTGADADIAEFRAAFDSTTLYLYIRPVSLNPAASFFTPYFGFGIDTGPGGRTTSLGYDWDRSASGVAELDVRPDHAPDFDLVFVGARVGANPRGARLLDAAGATVAAPAFGLSNTTGEIEIGVPLTQLGLAPPFARKRIAIVAYSGLETFGSMREVLATRSSWDPGGGTSDGSSPDAFDLIGADVLTQQEELADYAPDLNAMAIQSLIVLELEDAPPSGVNGWMFF